MPGLLTRAYLAEQPTRRIPAITRPLDPHATIPVPLPDELTERLPIIARLSGPFAREARQIMHHGESEDHLFLRLFLFWQHHNRQESDTALLRAYGRVEREAR